MSDQATIFELPYNLFLMQRMEFVVICGDQLAASIMRVVEAEMIKRKEAWQVRAEKAIEAKKPLPKEPKTWWVQLSQAQIIARLYMYDSAKLVKPENEDLNSPEWVEYRYKRALSISKATLKKAIELLKALGFLIERSKPGDEFGAPIYTLVKDNVQKALKALPANPFAIFHHLGGVENIESGGESKIFNIPPQNSDSGESKNLTVPPKEFSSGESKNFRVDIDSIIDPLEDIGIDNEEEGTLPRDPAPAPSDANASTPAQSSQDEPYCPDFNASQSIKELSPVIDEKIEQVDEQRASLASDGQTNTADQAQDAGYENKPRTATSQALFVASGRQQGARQSPSRVRDQARQNEKIQLTLLGGQVRTDYETIRACKLRLTQQNIKALNVLGELDGMSFTNLKETIDLIETQNLVKERNIPIDPQALASESGYWRFDKWYPVVIRNRAKQVSKSSANGQPPLTSASLPSYAHMSDKEYYASLGGVQRR